jgi:predicted DNA-binding helix-hairpin-helix protein
MEIFEKARILSESGRYDLCGPKQCEVKISPGLGGIYNARAENQKCILFKTLMSNSCSFDCKYCQNSVCRKKTRYTPEQLSRLFMYLNKKINVHGLFLSSAISGNPDKSTEEMLKAVSLIRFKHNFRGYIHFKILPGTSHELIKQASEISNRMSINIEAPNKSVLSEMCSCKEYKTDILRRQYWISRLNSNQTTQIIVNNIATDKEILNMMKWQYEKLNLKRVYFSAFNPVKGTPFQDRIPVKESRQNHLYNIDFLIRKYNFSFSDFSKILNQGMLPDKDPKLALALENFNSPLDISTASYSELIKIPGIGPKTAKIIINKKSQSNKIKLPKKSAPFIRINTQTQKMLSNFS